MMFFLYIVYDLLVGLSEATHGEADPVVQGKIRTAQVMTVISWCTYPVVYLFPMLGIDAAEAVVSIQLGYCVSDIISKCGVGLVIYQISYAKSCKYSDEWSKLQIRSQGAKAEAAAKLIGNHIRVIDDICNRMP